MSSFQTFAHSIVVAAYTLIQVDWKRYVVTKGDLLKERNEEANDPPCLHRCLWADMYCQRSFDAPSSTAALLLRKCGPPLHHSSPLTFNLNTFLLLP